MLSSLVPSPRVLYSSRFSCLHRSLISDAPILIELIVHTHPSFLLFILHLCILPYRPCQAVVIPQATRPSSLLRGRVSWVLFDFFLPLFLHGQIARTTRGGLCELATNHSALSGPVPSPRGAAAIHGGGVTSRAKNEWTREKREEKKKEKKGKRAKAERERERRKK